MLERNIDCLFLEGPVELPAFACEKNPGRQRARAWFLYRSKELYSPFGMEIVPDSLEKSFSLFRSEVDRIPENSRISLLGFSHGAVMVHLLACKMEHDPCFASLLERIVNCIIIGGFSARPMTWSRSQLHSLSVPSFHVIGLNDTRVSPDLSHDLVKMFQNSIVLEHDKGHVIPQQSAHCETMIDFIHNEPADAEKERTRRGTDHDFH
jgi:predicted esterase